MGHAFTCFSIVWSGMIINIYINVGKIYFQKYHIKYCFDRNILL